MHHHISPLTTHQSIQNRLHSIFHFILMLIEFAYLLCYHQKKEAFAHESVQILWFDHHLVNIRIYLHENISHIDMNETFTYCIKKKWSMVKFKSRRSRIYNSRNVTTLVYSILAN